MTDYGDLSTTELAKLINDEYGVILANERTNLTKALAVGEKLIALRQRVAPKHGNWQDKLRAWCPRISYETATKYIRVCDKWPDIVKAAKAKGVVTTDLTIEAALKLIAKPKLDSGNKSNSAVRGAVAEPSPNRSEAPDVALEGFANDEVFHTLWNVYENRHDDLLELTTRLARSLGMTLMRLEQSEALMAVISETAPEAA
jgi:hypothetical protein